MIIALPSEMGYDTTHRVGAPERAFPGLCRYDDAAQQATLQTALFPHPNCEGVGVGRALAVFLAAWTFVPRNKREATSLQRKTHHNQRLSVASSLGTRHEKEFLVVAAEDLLA